MKLSPDEVKKHELELLCYTVDFLDANGLRYSLYGGTLLGAVRHQGFIPWDDDIDICMPRTDYEKLIELAESIQEPYRLISGTNCETYSMPFAKMQDTRFRTRQAFAGAYPQHLWIDVFPIDGVPDDVNDQEKLIRRITLFKKIANSCWLDQGDEANLAKRTIRRAFRSFANTATERKVREKRDELIRSIPFEKAQHVSCLASFCRKPWRVPRDAFLEAVSVEFEGKTFWAMSCMDEFLAAVYGNYMELPPVECRVNHSLEVWTA